MSESTEIGVRTFGCFTVVSPTGELGVLATESLQRAFEPLLKGNAPQIALDLDDVAHVGSLGLAALVTLNSKIKSRDGRFVIGNVPQDVQRVFEISNLYMVLQVVDDLNGFLAEAERLYADFNEQLSRALSSAQRT
jgi:anti-anti-sigma factor